MAAYGTARGAAFDLPCSSGKAQPVTGACYAVHRTSPLGLHTCLARKQQDALSRRSGGCRLRRRLAERTARRGRTE